MEKYSTVYGQNTIRTKSMRFCNKPNQCTNTRNSRAGLEAPHDPNRTSCSNRVGLIGQPNILVLDAGQSVDRKSVTVTDHRANQGRGRSPSPKPSEPKTLNRQQHAFRYSQRFSQPTYPTNFHSPVASRITLSNSETFS